ncbi:hypothetical protein ACO1MW_13830, partial [Staphylococcus aureus]
MSVPIPGVKSVWLKHAMKFVKELNETHRASIYASIGDTRRAIREAGTLSFLPHHHFVQLTGAIARTLGADGARKLW